MFLHGLDFRLGNAAALYQVIAIGIDDVRSHLCQFFCRRITETQFLAGDVDGVLTLPGFQLHAGAIGTGVGHGVAAVAVGDTFQQIGQTRAANFCQRILGGLPYGLNVHAVHLFRGHFVGTGPFVDFRFSTVEVHVGADLVLVVFTDKQHR